MIDGVRQSRKMSPPSRPGFAILTVGLDARAEALIRRLSQAQDWVCDQARNYREALGYLRAAQERPPAVLLCGELLEDGSWLQFLEDLGGLTRLIVVSRIADESLWAEVLNRGGYDLLPGPLTERELQWTIDSARLAWECENTLPARRPPVLAATG